MIIRFDFENIYFYDTMFIFIPNFCISPVRDLMFVEQPQQRHHFKSNKPISSSLILQLPNSLITQSTSYPFKPEVAMLSIK